MNEYAGCRGPYMPEPVIPKREEQKMSLYNLVHGVNPFAGLLLGILGNPDVPRFRDCFLNEKEEIVIYTRTGGGNREYYESESECKESDYSGPWNSDLREIEGYLRDEDDSFDSTYALFYFKVPKEFEAMIKTLSDIGAKKVEKPSEAWQRVLDEMTTGKMSPQTKRALTAMEPIIEQINKALKE